MADAKRRRLLQRFYAARSASRRARNVDEIISATWREIYAMQEAWNYRPCQTSRALQKAAADNWIE